MENLWKIYDFYLKNYNLLLGKDQSLSSINNVLDTLLSKYEESLDLVSPHSLSLIISSSINFIELFKLSGDEVQFSADFLFFIIHYFLLISKKSYVDRYLNILRNFYGQIWGFYQDIRNFNDAFESFINILFSTQLFNFNHSLNKIQEFIKEVG